MSTSSNRAPEHALASGRRCDIDHDPVIDTGGNELTDVSQRNETGRTITERRVKARVDERHFLVDAGDRVRAEVEPLRGAGEHVEALEHDPESARRESAMEVDLHSISPLQG